jgi:hypothetical protein
MLVLLHLLHRALRSGTEGVRKILALATNDQKSDKKDGDGK